MTGIGELAQTVVVSAAPRTIRVSVFGGRTQLDIELPVDVPVADLVPELAALISSRDIVREDTPDQLENKRDRWVLTRLATGAEIPADQTLDDAGSQDGDLLRLTGVRALSPPELFDDVVDAVARLNRQGYATWGRSAARWMAFAALALTVAVLDVLLLGPADLGVRTILGYQTLGVIAAMIIAAVVAQRYYSEALIAAVLGWASLPLLFGVSTTFAEHLPDSAARWSSTLVCAVTALGALGAWRIIQTGRIGFSATTVAFTLFTVMSAAHTGFHWTAQTTGCVLAAAGVLLSVTTGVLTGWLRRRSAHSGTDGVDDSAPPPADPFANPFDRSAPIDEHRRVAARARERVPSVEEVAEVVERHRAIRTALYLAAVAVTVTGCAIAVGGPDTTPWSVITFCVLAAAALMLRATRGLPFDCSAVVLLGGVAVLVTTAVSLRWGSSAMYGAAALTLLLLVIVAIVVGTVAPQQHSERFSGVADHLEYLVVVALLPALAWAVGLYAAVGNR
ncbi:type VII secretion integral membrane protein EccD [Gordonia bronchialis]|uniref:type VII secretion integral membrane protein EccD n=1 Tax=Gordonia bronchialis TaxID=2054 RepID=UPI0024332F50|nr:type VII secretion integral membrane protein EccD [Gordonia bronchialis]